jgi:inner membrane protein
MKFSTHITFGILIGLILSRFYSFEPFYVFYFGIFLGSLFLDIDVPESMLGSKIKWLSRIIAFTFGHRGIIHSVYILILPIIIIYFSKIFGYGILIGMISHLLLDSLTKQGIEPFKPLSHYTIKGHLKTGGLFENLVFLGFIVGIVFMLLY